MMIKSADLLRQMHISIVWAAHADIYENTQITVHAHMHAGWQELRCGTLPRMRDVAALQKQTIGFASMYRCPRADEGSTRGHAFVLSSCLFTIIYDDQHTALAMRVQSVTALELCSA